MTEELVLTVEQTARLLHLGRSLCYDLCRRGELPVIRLGKRILIPRKALDEMLNVKVQHGGMNE